MEDLLFNGERAFKDLEKLAVEIGTRPSGSEVEKEAANWIASEFEAIGIKTSIEEFEVTTGGVISKKLEVLEPYKEEINCEVQPLYGGTGPEGVVGELVHLETLDEEYLTQEVTGKVILTSGRPKDRKKAFGILSKLKPLAVIIVESSPRILAKNLWGSSIVKEKFGDFPTVRVTYEDGLKLLEKGANRVRLIAETEVKKVKSHNVIGELAGSDRPEEVILIGGHYDTVLEVSGAEDNAGGTALVMELARAFKEKGTRRTMRFIAWGCEELGLLGSRDYATKLREASEKAKEQDEDAETELDKTLLCVNLDVHGAYIGTNSSHVLGPPELTASVKLLSKETGVVFNVEEGVYSSDGTSMSAVGVPSVSYSRRAPTNVFMHSTEDNVQWLSPKTLQTQGEFVERFLSRYVAGAAAFPFKREVPEKQKEKIKDYFKQGMRKLP
ncbi:MAG: M20/M25/M40 family metallo-hydrolase [Candidatus Bathyarchaeia archaeon]